MRQKRHFRRNAEALHFLGRHPGDFLGLGGAAKGVALHQLLPALGIAQPQLRALGIEQVERVASLTHTDQHFDQLVEVLAPQGRLALIDDPAALDILKLKRKSLSLHWEFMYTRSLFGTPDMIEQHRLLERVAELIDAGVLRTTLHAHFGRIDADNLRRAHALLESGESRGKIVLEGF